MAESLTHITDAELLDRYCEGDQVAFRELVERYKSGLYAFLHRFLNNHQLIEDVFQETFLQLFMSRDSFDRNRSLRPWLFTIAANKAKDALRKAQRTNAVSVGSFVNSDDMSFDEVFNLLACDTDVPVEALQQEETAKRVRQIISSMPVNLREILIMAYFNQFSYKQMAEILSIPIGTVKSRLHTAVGRFSKEWMSGSFDKE